MAEDESTASSSREEPAASPEALAAEEIAVDGGDVQAAGKLQEVEFQAVEENDGGETETKRQCVDGEADGADVDQEQEVEEQQTVVPPAEQRLPDGPLISRTIEIPNGKNQAWPSPLSGGSSQQRSSPRRPTTRSEWRPRATLPQTQPGSSHGHGGPSQPAPPSHTSGSGSEQRPSPVSRGSSQQRFRRRRPTSRSQSRPSTALPQTQPGSSHDHGGPSQPAPPSHTSGSGSEQRPSPVSRGSSQQRSRRRRPTSRSQGRPRTALPQTQPGSSHDHVGPSQPDPPRHTSGSGSGSEQRPGSSTPPAVEGHDYNGQPAPTPLSFGQPPESFQPMHDDSPAPSQQYYGQPPGSFQPMYDGSAAPSQQYYAQPPGSFQQVYDGSAAPSQQYYRQPPGSFQPMYDGSAAPSQQYYEQPAGSFQPSYDGSAAPSQQYYGQPPGIFQPMYDGSAAPSQQYYGQPPGSFQPMYDGSAAPSQQYYGQPPGSFQPSYDGSATPTQQYHGQPPGSSPPGSSYLRPAGMPSFYQSSGYAPEQSYYQPAYHYPPLPRPPPPHMAMQLYGPRWVFMHQGSTYGYEGAPLPSYPNGSNASSSSILMVRTPHPSQPAPTYRQSDASSLYRTDVSERRHGSQG